ncbi:MAG: hypothetical protein ABF868_06715 [Sporolactobacillus sp.]
MNRLQALLQNKKSEDYVFSSSKWITLLMIAGIVAYPLTAGWGTLVLLCLAIGLLIGRYLIAKQTSADFRDMHHAKAAYAKTKNKQYLRFIQARAKQMLADNKMLTKAAKEEINTLLGFAERRLF